MLIYTAAAKTKNNMLQLARYLAVCFILILIAWGMWAFLPEGNYKLLVIKQYSSGEIIFEKKLKTGENFTLAYIHSVTKQPVFEVYRLTGQETIEMVEMRYDSFGANLPVGAERLAAETTTFIVAEGYYKILYEDRQFEQLLLRTGQVIADHRFIFSDGTKVRLNDIVEGGTLLEIIVHP